MSLKSPLYVTAKSHGVLMLGGIFQMQDRVGFPVDASFEEARRHGAIIDWLEALCDCWLNDCLKFDSFVRQAESITGQDLKRMFSQTGAMVIAVFPKMKQTPNPVDTACRYILARKRLGRWT